MLNRKIWALVKHIIIIYFLKEGSSSDVGNWRARHFQPGSNTLKCLGHLEWRGWQGGRKVNSPAVSLSTYALLVELQPRI